MSEKQTKCPKVNLRSRTMLPKFSDADIAALAARVGLTKDQLETAGHIAYQMYQEIGADLAECNGGKPMRRRDVVEICLDAGRPQQAIRSGRCKYIKGAEDPAVLEWFQTKAAKYKLDHVYEAIAAVSFPYSEYE